MTVMNGWISPTVKIMIWIKSGIASDPPRTSSPPTGSTVSIVDGVTTIAIVKNTLLRRIQPTNDSALSFAAIRNLDFVRYHIFPVGYMARVSSTSDREQVRVAKKVIEAGIRFSYVGFAYIRKFRKIPQVRHVRVIFVTEPALVKELVPFAPKVSEITKTLTHILDGLPADCGHCSMKAVCDEVDGMRELHLGKKV